jgi:hypothetical protein
MVLNNGIDNGGRLPNTISLSVAVGWIARSAATDTNQDQDVALLRAALAAARRLLLSVYYSAYSATLSYAACLPTTYGTYLRGYSLSHSSARRFHFGGAARPFGARGT